MLRKCWLRGECCKYDSGSMTERTGKPVLSYQMAGGPFAPVAFASSPFLWRLNAIPAQDARVWHIDGESRSHVGASAAPVLK